LENEAAGTTTISAHVPSGLAQQVRALAEAGNRSTSREVAQALREHVEAATSGERPGT
jgi:predicted transcriptional regulator